MTKSTWIPKTIAVTVLLCPLLVVPGFADPVSLPKYALLVGVAAALVTGVVASRDRSHSAPPRAFVIAVGTFIGATVLATLTSPLTRLALVGEYIHHAGLVGYAACAAIAVVLSMTLRPHDLPDQLRAAIAGLGLVAAYGALQTLGLDPIEWQTYGFSSASSTMGNPNVLAQYLGAGLPLLAWALVAPGSARIPRIVVGGAAVAAAVALVGAGSQQAVLVALGGLGAFGIIWVTQTVPRFSTVGGRRATIAVGGLCVAGLTAAAAAAVAAAPVRLLGERLYLWHAALEMFRDEPVTGVGLEMFGVVFTEYRPAAHAVAYGDTIADAAHSVPLHMFAVGGAPLGLAHLGVVAVVAVVLVRGLSRVEGQQRLLLGAVGATWFAYQLGSIVSFDRPPTMLLHWWSAGAVVVAAGQLSVRRQRRSSEAALATALAVAAFALVTVWFAVVVPARADLHAAGGVEAAQAGQAQAARERLETATTLAPYRAQYWIWRADVLQRIGDPAQAAEVAAEGAERIPGEPVLPLFAARLYEAIGEPDEARRWFAVADQRNPHSTAGPPRAP